MMKVIKNIAGLLSVFIISGATLLPVSVTHKLWQGETIWVIQAIREMHPGVRFLPTLGHRIIHGQNPLNIILLSLVSSNSPLSYRFIFIPGALAMIILVFVFCKTLWGTRSAVWTSILLSTSYGFIKTYASINTVALPATMATMGIILFFLAYLNEYKSLWYIISYTCISLATITGGWIFLAFSVITILLLVLLDLSPERLLDAVPAIGIGILVVCVLGFYLIFRIAASSSAYVYNALSHGQNMGFLETLAALAKYTMPWIPLIIPAWLHTKRSKDHEVWRKALPSKIAFSACIIVLWFSSRCEMEYAILAVPFSSIIIGHWVAASSPGLVHNRLNKWMLYLVGLCIFTYTSTVLTLSIVIGKFFGTREILSFVLLVVAGITLSISLFKKRLKLSLYLSVVSVIISSWIYSLCYIPVMDAKHNPTTFIEELSNYRDHLAVFEDDLVTRAWIAYREAGHPYLVREGLEPVGEDVYLVFYDRNSRKLLRHLRKRMEVEMKETFYSEKRFTLVRLSPT